MGQILSEPVLHKNTESHASKRFIAAATEMQGWRIGMEDAHQVVLEISKTATLDSHRKAEVQND